MARVHRLQHIEGFFATDLTYDDSVGTHTQRVDQQLPLLDGTLSFDVRRPGFEAHNVFLVQLQLRRIFYGHDSFAVGNERRQDVQQSGFTGAGSARDQNVQASLHAAM